MVSMVLIVAEARGSLALAYMSWIARRRSDSVSARPGKPKSEGSSTGMAPSAPLRTPLSCRGFCFSGAVHRYIRHYVRLPISNSRVDCSVFTVRFLPLLSC